jgi:hypothetical protein
MEEKTMVRIIQPLLSEAQHRALERVIEYLESERQDFLAAEPHERTLHIYQDILTLRTITRPTRFDLGRFAQTPGAADALERAGQEPSDFLARHAAGDWGEVTPDDWEENEFSVTRELRILSAYRTRKGERIWVITEADRSFTTLLLPEEY